MSSFQVAHFTAVQQPEEVVVAAAPQGAAPAAPEGLSDSPEGAEYWEKLLGQQHRDMQEAELEALGKGKRERKQVSNQKHSQAVSPYSSPDFVVL